MEGKDKEQLDYRHNNMDDMYDGEYDPTNSDYAFNAGGKNSTEEYDYIEDSEDRDKAAEELEDYENEDEEDEDELFSESGSGDGFYRRYGGKERYNAEVKDKLRERFAVLAEMAKRGGEERKKANTEATIHLSDLINSMIMHTFREYVKADPDYKQELFNAACAGIYDNLPKYDSTKGAPTTFFTRPIKHELVHLTNKTKNNVKPHTASIKKKIEEIRREYEAHGVVPNESDFLIAIKNANILGTRATENLSRIRDTLKHMNQVTSSFEMLPEDTIAGDPDKNTGFESPEAVAVSNVTVSKVLERMHMLLSDEEIQIFMMSAMNGDTMNCKEISKVIGRTEDSIRCTIDHCKNVLQYDPIVRALFFGRSGPKELIDDMAPVVPIIIPLEDAEEELDALDAYEDRRLSSVYKISVDDVPEEEIVLRSWNAVKENSGNSIFGTI